MILLRFLIAFLIAFILKELSSLKKIYKLNLIVYLLLLVAFFQWYIIPIVLSQMGYWYFFEDMLKIDLYKYNCYAIAELAFYSLILYLLNKTSRYHIIKSYSIKSAHSKIFSQILIYLFLIDLVIKMFSNSSYEEANSISNAEGGFGMLLYLLMSFVGCYVFANVLMSKSSKIKKGYIILACVATCLSVIGGARIYLLSFIWIYVACRQSLLYEKKFIKFLTPIFIGLIVSVASLPLMASWRTGVSLSFSDMDKKVLVEAGMFHVNLKLNSIAYASALIERDKPGFAGGTPYVGSIFKFIPRGVWKDKPTPLSYNGTIEGTPARRIPRLLNFTDIDSANTGNSPFAVALWHGIPFVVISIVLNVLYMRGMFYCFSNDSMWIRAIGLKLIYFPQLIMTPASGDDIIQKGLEAFAFIIFLSVFKVISINKKSNENYYFPRRFGESVV